ncbi:MAG: TetR/AcrR family transcriptional regulator [Oscillospiraceae bacterium]|nr:TetR/AcrR family transcriptional regulator [Oscillospiraceae bacterium]
MQTDYSEKEILVFKGLEKLMNDGVNMYTVKVQDIAAAAGIGKGTLYEYFESKEQIIARALLYFLDTSTRHAQSCVDAAGTFEQKWQILMELSAQSVKQHKTTFQIMMSGVDTQQIYRYTQTYEPAMRAQTKRMEQLFSGVIKKGVTEGILSPNHPNAYIEQATAAALTGFAQYICRNGQTINQNQIQQAKQYSYQMLVKMLA